MSTKIQFGLLALSVAILTACNSNPDDSYSCGTGICSLGPNGDYDNAEECQLACNAGSGVTDVDGNTYSSIIIGDEEWTMSNLNVSHYRNGDPIPEVQDFAAWQDLTTGAWCYYENNTANGPVYGKLYNWYAVTDPRGLAPEGWHIPTDSVMVAFIDFLGGFNDAGGKMKSTGTSLWLSPNAKATNASGFSGLPGGTRDRNLNFRDIGGGGYWWNSTESSSAYAWGQYVQSGFASSTKISSRKENGHSVRCVKD